MKKLILLVIFVAFEFGFSFDKFVYKKNDVDRIYEDKRVVLKSEFPSFYYDEVKRIRVSVTDVNNKLIFVYLEGKDSFIFKEVAHRRLSKDNEGFFKPFEDKDKIFLYKVKDKYLISFYEGYRVFNGYVTKDNRYEYSIIDNYFN
jgi:hypothetical protein